MLQSITACKTDFEFLCLIIFEFCADCLLILTDLIVMILCVGCIIFWICNFLRDHHLLLLPTHYLHHLLSLLFFSFIFTGISNLLSLSGIWSSICLILWLTRYIDYVKISLDNQTHPFYLFIFLKIIMGLMKAKLCLPWLVWTSIEAPKLVTR